jgi:hypothetical protein
MLTLQNYIRVIIVNYDLDALDFHKLNVSFRRHQRAGANVTKISTGVTQRKLKFFDLT